MRPWDHDGEVPAGVMSDLIGPRFCYLAALLYIAIGAGLAILGRMA